MKILTAVLIAASSIVGLDLAAASPAAAAGPCSQYRSTALAAGFTSAQWPKVARIMYRESRCRPNAHNRSGAHGLMQIMPMWKRRCGANLSSPSANLRCARLILRVQGWGAWATR